MSRAGGPRVEGYAALAAAGFLAALALRRPELAAIATPFALSLALGLRFRPDPRVVADLVLDAERTLEGMPVAAELRLRADVPVDRLEVAVALPPGIEVLDAAPARALRLGPELERRIPLRLRPRRWGVYELGRLGVRAWDPLRVVVWEKAFPASRRLRAYPDPAGRTRMVAALETQVFAGSEVSRAKGEGIEHADLRDYLLGDRLRAINWRASARRGTLVVNERHPERNTDVVLLLDTFTDLRGGGFSTLEEAARIAAALAERALERRDRVGLVSLGGVLRWLRPDLGLAQRHRLLETLVETTIEPTYTWRGVELLPTRILPAGALVIALTPLVDRRFVSALVDLRSRGFDLVVLELDAASALEPEADDLAALATRIWLLEREASRARLRELGVAVALWAPARSLDAAVEEVRAYRRHARLSRA